MRQAHTAIIICSFAGIARTAGFTQSQHWRNRNLPRKIGCLNLGLAFAGCFLGAGYVSGQELWQFFGSFGIKGAAGLLLAVALLLFAGVVMILLGCITGLKEIDKLVVRRNVPVLRGAVMLLELLFLFGVGTIMSAGIGALLNQLFGLAPFIGSAKMSLRGYCTDSPALSRLFCFSMSLQSAATRRILQSKAFRNSPAEAG